MHWLKIGKNIQIPTETHCAQSADWQHVVHINYRFHIYQRRTGEPYEVTLTDTGNIFTFVIPLAKMSQALQENTTVMDHTVFIFGKTHALVLSDKSKELFSEAEREEVRLQGIDTPRLFRIIQKRMGYPFISIENSWTGSVVNSSRRE